MDDPIISPWTIYIIDVCNSIIFVAMFFSLLGVFATIFAFIVVSVDDVDIIQAKKLLKGLTIFTTTFIIVSIIVPDKRVGYTMLATQYITEGNVQQAAKIVDRIADKIIQVKNNSQENDEVKK